MKHPGSCVTGVHCEQMTDISQDSLGSRLLEEPFWIGIIVVLGVLVITGFVVLIRKKLLRHFDCNCCLRRTKSTDKSSGLSF